MDPVAIVNAAVIGIDALLKVIASYKSQSGLTDDQIMAQFDAHAPETKQAIAGYLANLT